MIVEMAAVLVGELAESLIGVVLDAADRHPERINTPEKQENLEKVQDGYSVVVHLLKQNKQNLKDIL